MQRRVLLWVGADRTEEAERCSSPREWALGAAGRYRPYVWTCERRKRRACTGIRAARVVPFSLLLAFGAGSGVYEHLVTPELKHDSERATALSTAWKLFYQE